MDKAGRDIYTCIDYVDIERHLPFEDPEISVAIQGDVLSIKALPCILQDVWRLQEIVTAMNSDGCLTIIILICCQE